MADGAWNVAVGGVVQATAPTRSYSAEYVELDPGAEQFATEENPDLLGIERSALELDRRSESEVRALLLPAEGRGLWRSVLRFGRRAPDGEADSP